MIGAQGTVHILSPTLDLPEVLDQISGIASNTKKSHLGSIEANNASWTLGVLCKQAELGMSHSESEKCSERHVDVASLDRSVCTCAKELESFTCSRHSTRREVRQP